MCPCTCRSQESQEVVPEQIPWSTDNASLDPGPQYRLKPKIKIAFHSVGLIVPFNLMFTGLTSSLESDLVGPLTV